MKNYDFLKIGELGLNHFFDSLFRGNIKSNQNSQIFLFVGLFILLTNFFFSYLLIAQDKVVGYYPSWNKSTLPADQMEFENLTHINHAFAWPDADGSISAYANFHYPELIKKTHEAGKKILVSLGGWGNCGGFSSMAADSAARANFVENIISFSPPTATPHLAHWQKAQLPRWHISTHTGHSRCICSHRGRFCRL